MIRKLTIFTFVASLLMGCKDQEVEPLVSIVGTWEFDHIESEELDALSIGILEIFYVGTSYTFKEDNSFEAIGFLETEFSGEWNYKDNVLTMTVDGEEEMQEVTKLTNSELHFFSITEDEETGEEITITAIFRKI